MQHLLFTILTNESHLPFSSKTEKVPRSVIILTIMAIATLSNVQWMVDLRLDTVHLVSPVLYIIPTIAITALNVAIFRQLKRLLHTDQFSSLTDEIKKVLFKIRLTNLIAIIFVGAQIAYAINACLVIVSWFSFLFF